MTKKELDLIIEEERNLYLGQKIKKMKKSKHKRYFIFMYLFYFRKCQYYMNLRKDKKSTKTFRNLHKEKEGGL